MSLLIIGVLLERRVMRIHIEKADTIPTQYGENIYDFREKCQEK